MPLASITFNPSWKKIGVTGLSVISAATSCVETSLLFVQGNVGLELFMPLLNEDSDVESGLSRIEALSKAEIRLRVCCSIGVHTDFASKTSLFRASFESRDPRCTASWGLGVFCRLSKMSSFWSRFMLWDCLSVELLDGVPIVVRHSAGPSLSCPRQLDHDSRCLMKCKSSGAFGYYKVKISS